MTREKWTVGAFAFVCGSLGTALGSLALVSLALRFESSGVAFHPLSPLGLVQAASGSLWERWLFFWLLPAFPFTVGTAILGGAWANRFLKRRDQHPSLRRFQREGAWWGALYGLASIAFGLAFPPIAMAAFLEPIGFLTVALCAAASGCLLGWIGALVLGRHLRTDRTQTEG